MKTLKDLLAWFRSLRVIVRMYWPEWNRLHQRISELEKTLRDRTDIGVSCGFRGDSYVIVVGRYRNRDYVETYKLHGGDFETLIHQLGSMARTGTLRIVDAPPQLRAVIKSGANT